MKFNIFLLLFVLAIFTGCESDDDNDSASFEPSAESFVGAFNVTALAVEGESSFTFEGETVTSTFSDVGSDFDLVWTFNADNTYSLVGSYTSEITQTTNGETTTENELEELDEAGTYALDITTNTLVLTDEDTSFNINTFTESVVELGSTESDSEDDFSTMSTLSVRLERQ